MESLEDNFAVEIFDRKILSCSKDEILDLRARVSSSVRKNM